MIMETLTKSGACIAPSVRIRAIPHKDKEASRKCAICSVIP